jgi:hypothetical protein
LDQNERKAIASAFDRSKFELRISKFVTSTC